MVFLKKLIATSVFICLILSTAFAQVAGTVDSVTPLLIGKKIPSTTLTSADGKNTTTDQLLSGKQTILIFYRGGWCPYCNIHLKELQGIESRLIGLGYQVVAVSPDAPSQLTNTSGKDSLQYKLFSDSHTELIRKMGLAFRAPEKYGKMLSDYSLGGNTEAILPAPGVFITDKTGKIIFEYVNPDFKHRLSGNLLLAAASALSEEMKKQ